MDQASLLTLALSDALATFPEGSLWVDAALAPEGPRSKNALVAVVAVPDADADGHASPVKLEHAAEGGAVIWGVGAAGFAFSDRVLTGPRLHRLYTARALLSFEADPLPQWRVRRVLAGVSARDLQAECPFRLVAGPDLAPLRQL